MSFEDSLRLSLNELLTHLARAMPLDGASVTVATPVGNEGVTAWSPGMDRVTDLQLVLGEGPAHDAIHNDRLSAVDDLAHAADRWLAFTPAAIDLGITCVLALPLRIGSIRFGALSFYNAAPREFDGSDIRQALQLGTIVIESVISRHEQSGTDGRHDVGETNNAYRSVIHQASGMASVQLDCSVGEALVRLRAYAFAQGLTLEQVSQQIVRRELRLEA